MTLRQSISRAALLVAGLGLAGCSLMPGRNYENTAGQESYGSMSGVPAPALNAELEDGTQSEVITHLMHRRSILGQGPYAQISNAVMAANTRSAESELRAAMLRSEAASMNWLPRLGPSLSLDSLGAVIAQMVVDQVIFDNGGKKAERDFAQHDVEVTAVALAQNSNDRVQDALDLYLRAEAHNAKAGVIESVVSKMERYEYVMGERVSGGVSSSVDLSIVQQKLGLLRSELASDHQSAGMAIAELNAMSATPINGVHGAPSLGLTGVHVTPLDVMKAQAEGARAEAAATAKRAGFLPGVSLSGLVGDSSDFGLNVAAPNGIGFGMGASMEAIEATKQAAQAQVGQAREDSDRALAAMQARIDSLQAQHTQKRATADQAARNYELFEAQWREGTRTMPELVGQLETMIKARREAIVLPYDIARAQVEKAALLGVLVDGDKV